MKASTVALLLSMAGVAPALAGDLKDELTAVEKTAWTAWASHNGDAFRALLTEDAVQAVAGAGVTSGRDKIITDINNGNCVVKAFEFSDVKLRQLSADIAVLSYTATQETDCEGQSLPGKVYSTSIYIRQGGKWRSMSYQETPL